MLSVVGFAETAKAWPAKIAAANPAMPISRRGWSWKDTIACFPASLRPQGHIGN
jgi:hypothetical protein